MHIMSTTADRGLWQPNAYDPGVPLSVRLVPMSADQFRSYRVAAERSYVENIARSGLLPELEALQADRGLVAGNDPAGDHAAIDELHLRSSGQRRNRRIGP